MVILQAGGDPQATQTIPEKAIVDSGRKRESALVETAALGQTATRKKNQAKAGVDPIMPRATAAEVLQKTQKAKEKAKESLEGEAGLLQKGLQREELLLRARRISPLALST